MCHKFWRSLVTTYCEVRSQCFGPQFAKADARDLRVPGVDIFGHSFTRRLNILSIRTQRGSTRFGVAAIAAALIASLFAFASPAGAITPASPTVRYAGADRYETAAQAALGNFAAGANPNVILASGENFPDGLAAAYLAGAHNAPVLLTAQASLPAATANALGVLAAANTNVHVVGGTAAISANVRTQLAALGYTVKEVSGADRYETAAAVAAAAANVAGVGSFQNSRTAIIATGNSYPDALAAGPWSYSDRLPVLLTDSNTLSASAEAALGTLAIQRVVILGGTAAVSAGVADAIAAKGIAVQRISGANRNATAAALAGTLIATPVDGGAGWSSTAFTLASGTNFPDALAASQVGAKNVAPIVLTDAGVPAESAAYLAATASVTNAVYVMGGTAAVSADALAAARTAATPITITAEITAEQGRSSFTVKFSEAVLTSSVQGTDFTFASVGRTIAGGAVTPIPAGATATDQFAVAITPTPAGSGFLIGDVVNLTANSVTSATVPGRSNAAATVTVGQDTTKPTATLVAAYNGSTTVWVQFSEQVEGAVSAVAIPVTVGGVTGSLAVVPGIGNQNLWSATLGSNALHGQQITIAQGALKDQAGNLNDVIVGTVVTDNLPPSLVSASYTNTPSTAAGKQATVVLEAAATADDVLSITAKAAAAAGGVNGNLWKVVAGNAGTTLGVTVNTAIREIGINGPIATATPTDIVAMLNNDANFKALFTAAVVDGTKTGIDLGTPKALAGGESTVVVTGVFSEALDPTFGGLVAAVITGAQAGGQTVIAGGLNKVSTYTYTATAVNQLPSQVVLAAGTVRDLAGNLNAAQTAVNITPA